MSLIAKHVFVSGRATTADAGAVQGARDWDDGHTFTGGNHGSLLVRDTSDATYGASWLQSVALGQVLVSAGVGSLPAWSASPTLTSLALVAGIISASAPALVVTQTWSNGGVTFTGLSLTVTDSASAGGSLLMDLRTSAGSKFLVDKNGGVISQGSIQVQGSGNGLQIPNNGSFGFTGRSNFVSSADGILVFYNNGQNGFTAMRIGGEAATNPALKRDTIFLQLRLGDDSGVSGAATGSLPVAAAARDGIIGFDTTLNALVYYVGGARFKLAGTSF